MRYEYHNFLASESVPPPGNSPEDDLDRLFMNNLPRLEPPPGLISHILSTVKKLPLPDAMQSIEFDQSMDVLPDGLIIRNNQRGSH